MRKVIVLILLVCLPLLAQESAPVDRASHQYLNIPMPMKGMNTGRVSRLQPDEAAYLSDFLFRNGELQCRDGVLDVLGGAWGTDPIDFLGGFWDSGLLRFVILSGGYLYLVDSDDTDVTSDDVLNAQVYSVGSITGDSLSYIVTSNGNLTYWKSIFAGTKPVLQWHFRGVTHTANVNYFRDNVTMVMEDPLPHEIESDSSVTYSLRTGVTDVVFGEMMVNSYWMLTDFGLAEVTDTLHLPSTALLNFSFESNAQNHQDSTTVFAISNEFGDSYSYAATLAERLYMFTYQNNVADDDSSAFPADTFYTMTPCYYGGTSTQLETRGSPVNPAIDSNAYFSLHRDLAPLNETIRNIVADSLVIVDAWLSARDKNTSIGYQDDVSYRNAPELQSKILAMEFTTDDSLGVNPVASGIKANIRIGGSDNPSETIFPVSCALYDGDNRTLIDSCDTQNLSKNTNDQYTFTFNGGNVSISSSHLYVLAVKEHSTAADKVTVGHNPVGVSEETLFSMATPGAWPATLVPTDSSDEQMLLGTYMPILGYDTVHVKTVKVLCDTCDFTDSTFESGDWFITLGAEAVITDTGDIWKYNVVGGAITTDSAVYANAMGMMGSDTADAAVTFYRRGAARIAEGYRVGAFWRDRLCTVADSTPSQIDFSELFDPDSASGFITKVNPDDGEKITFLEVMYGVLVIGKQSSISKLTGVPGQDSYARLEKAWEGNSFVSAGAVCNRGGLLFGLARDGFYMYDFNSMVKVSDPIESYVRDSINWDYSDKVTIDFWDDHYWISYPQRGSDQNNRCLVFHPDYQAWGRTTLIFSDIVQDRATDDSAYVYLAEANETQPAIVLYGDIVGTTVGAEWCTGWLDLGSPWYEKTITRLGLMYSGGVSNFTMYIYTDDATVAATNRIAASVGGSGAEYWYRRHSKFEFIHDATRGFEHQLRIIANITLVDFRIGELGVEYQIEAIDY